jgi:hypothetical protein
MEDKNEKKVNFAPSQKAPYKKPQLQNYGTMENIARADIPPGKVFGGTDAFSGMGHGKGL